MTHILVRQIYFFYSSIFNVSTAHKQGDIAVRVDTIRSFTTNIKQIILYTLCNLTDVLLYGVI